MTKAILKLNKLNKTTLFVTITRSNEFGFRLFIAKKLIKTAAWIIGCGIDFRFDNQKE